VEAAVKTPPAVAIKVAEVEMWARVEASKPDRKAKAETAAALAMLVAARAAAKAALVVAAMAVAALVVAALAEAEIAVAMAEMAMVTADAAWLR